MQAINQHTDATPRLPRPLSFPFTLVPDSVNSKAIVAVLNRLFATALREGDLGFLQDRMMRIHVSDMQLTFRITLKQARLAAASHRQLPDLSITGTLHAFLLLAARHEDADTLFFQRRLCTEGDTELGLEVKNFLDSQDLDSHWLSRQLEVLTQKALPLYEHIFG